MADGKKKITFWYKGFLEDGTMFIDGTKKEPMVITVGYHSVMPELENALLEMEPDEERRVLVPLAYGEYDEDAVQRRIMRYAIPNGDELAEGMEIMWTSPQNPLNPIPAKIVRADEYSFDIDFNHPLAGKDLEYWLKLVSVETESAAG